MNRNAIRALVVAPGMCLAPDCPAQFQNGQFVTYSQEAWGNAPSAASQLLLSAFDVRYPTGFEVGIPGPSGFSMAFTSAFALLDYLPAGGSFGPLTGDLLDPSSSASGAYGGFVCALQLDVDFNDSGDLTGTSPVLLGDLELYDLAAPLSDFNGRSLRQFLGTTNFILGGGNAPHPIDDVANLTEALTRAFEGGLPTAFAQGHLRVPCYPDCNSDGVLTVQDFGCFQTEFAAASTYADCNADGALTVSDFGCFQTVFVAGCP